MSARDRISLQLICTAETSNSIGLSDPPTTPVELPPNPVTPEPPAHPIESPPSENPVPVREPPNVNPPVAASWTRQNRR